jgi:hypothetical protein
MKSAVALRPKVAGTRLPSSTDDVRATQAAILNFALRRDPAFAEQLAKLVLASYPPRRAQESGIYWLYLRDQTALYTRIAKHIAASDPQHAAELLRASFNTSYSRTQMEALNALRPHASSRADEIFLYALTLVKKKPTSLSNKVGLLAPYVFPEIQNEVGNALRHSGDAAEPAQVNADVIKPFLEFVYDTFMQQAVGAQTAENNEFGTASFDYHTMQALVPYFERHLPEKAAPYRTRVNEVFGSIKKAGRQDMFDREDEAWGEFFRQNIQEMLDRAAASKTEAERGEIYEHAAN